MQRPVWPTKNSHDKLMAHLTSNAEVLMANWIVNAWSRMSVDSESESPWISVQSLGCCLWKSLRHKVTELHTSMTSLIFNVIISFQRLLLTKKAIRFCLVYFPRGVKAWAMAALPPVRIFDSDSTESCWYSHDTLQHTVECSRVHQSEVQICKKSTRDCFCWFVVLICFASWPTWLMSDEAAARGLQSRPLPNWLVSKLV